MSRPTFVVVMLSGVFCATGLAALKDYEKSMPVDVQTPPGFPETPQNLGATGSGQMLGDVPGLAVTTPPPPWIAPGLRLTYYTMTGFLTNGPHEYILDAKGGWKDKQGNRYKRNDIQGGGSNGLLQFNIVGMDQQKAAVQMLFYLYDGMNTSEPQQKLETGYVGQGGNGGDLWLHPEALKALVGKYANQPPPKFGQGGMWVSQIQKQIEQATYNAVQIALMAESGSRKVWVYDLASGVLLYSSEINKISVAQTQTARVHPGGSMVKFTTFKGSRMLSVPWAQQPAPAWVARARTFRYRGTFQVNIPGSPATPFPVNATITVAERGADWLKFDVATGNQAPGASSEMTVRVAGNSMLCGSWIPPTAMGTLQAGQVLDSDPFTKVTVQVGAADAQHVTLVHNSPRQQIQYTYRRQDGLLVRTLFNDRFNRLNMSNQIELSLVSTE